VTEKWGREREEKRGEREGRGERKRERERERERVSERVGESERIEGGYCKLNIVTSTFTRTYTQLLRNGKEKEQDTPSHQRGHPVEDVDSAATPTTSGSVNPAPVEPLVTAAAVNSLAFHEKGQPFAEKNMQVCN
jgi:hypothetical protein